MAEKTISLRQVKALIAERDRLKKRCAELDAEVAALRKPIYNNVPGAKRAKTYQVKLEKARTAVRRGDLKKLGRADLKRALQCGDDVAKRVQVDLVHEGLAKWTEGGQIRLAA